MRTRFLIAFFLAATPFIAEAAGAPKNLQDLSGQLFDIISSATVTLVIVAFVVYMWGIAANFTKLNQGETEEMKQYYFWGIIILFMMVSVWGILRLMQATVFNGDVPGSNGGSQAKPCTDWANCGPNA